jgi:hypothetical protein
MIDQSPISRQYLHLLLFLGLDHEQFSCPNALGNSSLCLLFCMHSMPSRTWREGRRGKSGVRSLASRIHVTVMSREFSLVSFFHCSRIRRSQFMACMIDVPSHLALPFLCFSLHGTPSHDVYRIAEDTRWL